MNRRTVTLIAIVIIAMFALWMPAHADDAEPTLSPDTPVWATLNAEDSIRTYDFENDTVSTLAMISGDMDSSPRMRLIDEGDNSVVAEIHFESLASLLCVLPGSYRIEVIDSNDEAGNEDADQAEPFMMVMVEGCDMMSTTSAQLMLTAAAAAQQIALNASDNGESIVPVVGGDDGTSVINDNGGNDDTNNGGGNNGGGNNGGGNNGGGNNGGGNNGGNPTTPTCLLSTNSLSLFDSPFLAATSRLTVNATVGILGHTADAAWLLVDVNGRIGYVATATVTLPATCVSLPTITLPHDTLDLVDGVITVVNDVVVNTVCELTNTSFNLYAHPELSANVSLLATAQPNLIGRTADGVWLLVNASGQIGFVAAASVDLSNACGSLPIINIAHDVVEIVDGTLVVVSHVVATVVDVVDDVVTDVLDTATNAVCALNATSLSVYSSASLNANVSAAVNANGLILGRTSDNAWLLVNVNGSIGYVAAVTVNLPSACAALPLVNIPHEVVTLVGNVLTVVSTIAAEAEDVVVEVVDGSGTIVTTVVPGIVTTAIPNIVTTVVAPVSDIVTTTVPNIVTTVVAPVEDIVTTTVPDIVTTTVPNIVATAVPQIVTTTVPQIVATAVPQIITTTVPNIISTVVAPIGGLLP